MLLPQWKKRLEEVASEGRELKLQNRKEKVAVVAVKPGLNQVDVIEFATMRDYLKFCDEIEQFFDSKRKD